MMTRRGLKGEDPPARHHRAIADAPPALSGSPRASAYFYFLSVHRQFKKKGGVGSAKHRPSLLIFFYFLSVHRQFQKKGSVGFGRRRAKGLGRRLQSATEGRLSMSSRFTASSRRRAASALGTAGPRGSGGACSAAWGRLATPSRFTASSRSFAHYIFRQPLQSARRCS